MQVDFLILAFHSVTGENGGVLEWRVDYYLIPMFRRIFSAPIFKVVHGWTVDWKLVSKASEEVTDFIFEVLIFCWPCIVIYEYSYSKNQQDALFTFNLFQ